MVTSGDYELVVRLHFPASLWSGLNRKTYNHFGSYVHLTEDADLGIVLSQDVVRRVQSEPTTGRFSREKRVKDFFSIADANPMAIIT